MTIAVTGGAGFIGAAAIKAIRAETDEEILCLDNLHPQVHGPDARPPAFLDAHDVRFVQMDVTDRSAWDALLENTNPGTVVHLAAETGTGQSLLQATRHAQVNVIGTAVMLDAFAAAGRLPHRIILTSSRAVYGEGAWLETETGIHFYAAARTPSALESGVWEPVGPSGGSAEFLAHRAASTEPRPTNIYAATKLAQENIAAAWTTSLGVSLTVLRLQNVYGAGQAVGNPYTGVLTTFARQALSGTRISVYEGGAILRDFVHVTDVGRVILRCVLGTTGEDTRAVGPQTFDIGSGTPLTLAQCARVLVSRVPGAEVTITDEFRPGDVRAAYADIRDAQTALGYRPQVTFETGADDLLAWVRAQIDAESA